MSIQVNMTVEEVSAYRKQKFEAITGDESWTFKALMTETEEKKLKEELHKNLDSRKYKDLEACKPHVQEFVFGKLKYFPTKIVDFNPSGLSEVPEVIEAFTDKIIELLGIRNYKPSQQTLEETE